MQMVAKYSADFLRLEKHRQGRVQAYDADDEEIYVSAEIRKGIVETMPHQVLISALSESCV
jgi:hypothetical protein